MGVDSGGVDLGGVDLGGVDLGAIRLDDPAGKRPRRRRRWRRASRKWQQVLDLVAQPIEGILSGIDVQCSLVLQRSDARTAVYRRLQRARQAGPLLLRLHRSGGNQEVRRLFRNRRNDGRCGPQEHGPDGADEPRQKPAEAVGDHVERWDETTECNPRGHGNVHDETSKRC